MDFSSMIIKNIKHNIKNYTAYLLGNSLIQCILFMFFTLIFSQEFMNADETIPLKANINSTVIIMVAFSAIFIIFTTVSFTKYRGKEFGVYFTIGLTSKEIIKILCYENIIISMLSFLFASIGGSVFSKLFHMAIGKILRIDNILIPLSFKAYGTILLISAGIFLFTTGYQMVFLKRYSVINILKSKSKKDVGSTSVILGIIGIIIFISSLIAFNMLVNDNAKINSNLVLSYSIFGTAVSVYLLIGFSMTVVVKVLRKFKRTYNNNILFVNSLAHRFMSYKSVLYVVALMVSGAMIFISMAYSNYKSTERKIEIKYPYDMSFIVDKSQMNNKNIKDIVLKNLGEVKNYIALEGLNIPDIRVYEGKCLYRRFNLLVISEDNYRSLGKKELNLKRGEVLYSHTQKTGGLLDGGFILDLSKKEIKDEVSLDQYKEQHKMDEYMYVANENKRDEVSTAVNTFYSDNYLRGDEIVVNNEDYNMMKEKLGDEVVTYDVLFNVKNSEGHEGLKDSLESNLSKAVSDTLIIKESMFDAAIKGNGFMLFIFSFMGMMFLIGSAAVLYFKTIASIEEDRERSKQLMKIGLTRNEINKLAMKELGAVFLVPPVIALTCTGYFLSTIFNVISDGENMWKNSLFVFAVYSVIQIIFYVITSSKYKKQINRI
ncbi:FtsX-like permease family protein [Clostridium vincentii]|uniref:ABC transporter permease protein YxdM n=1 Tax=Clostridium vincentii TaxID=52704 RepID=A0A2T0BJW8_9CLOT|nr:ABC transporter permease [Clostridium vincentii]PRR84171.1 ABC transporter permease protein YxdM [Clostridium vincentii]